MTAIELEVPARLDQLVRLRAAVLALGSRMPADRRPPPRQLQAWALAVHEAAANIVAHGYGGDCDAPIRLRIEPAADGVRFMLEDRGAPNPLPRLEPGLWDERGRGLQLIRALVDELEYARTGGWNRTLLAIRLE